MTTDEAYQLTRDAVEELRRGGIVVRINPSRSQRNPEMRAKYRGPERVSPDKWINVTFFPETDAQRKEIHQRARELSWRGIFFDTGGSSGGWNWELDWSFRYLGVPDGGVELTRSIVEDLKLQAEFALTPMPEIVLIPYDEARPLIRQADIPLRRAKPGSPGEWVIARAGKSPYAHAAEAAWWLDRLMLLEMTAGHGGRTWFMSRAVEEAGSGMWDVYRITLDVPPETLDNAVRGMIDILGYRYGWLTIARRSLYHLPIIRRFMPEELDDLAPSNRWVCSTAIARAWREFAGIDLCPGMADRAVEPGDLARSKVLDYQFTIATSNPH